MTTYLETLPPETPSAVPARRAVPVFPPIRLRGTGRHRLQQAVRHRPGALAAGALAAATALAAAAVGAGPPPVPAAQCRLHR